MSKITIDGIEELLGLKPPPPPKGVTPKGSTPPLVTAQNQNPMPSGLQTGVPSVAPPPPKGFPQAQLQGNPRTTQTAVAPPAVVAQYRKNQKTDTKRKEGTALRQIAQATPPPPPATPAGAPVQYQPPNKTLDTIGLALATLFGGSRMGAAGAGLVQGLQKRSDTTYDRALQQRQDQIAAAQQGYNFQTGQPTQQNLLTGKQEYTPPDATPQQLEQHYLRLADILTQNGSPQALEMAKQYTAQAQAVAGGFEKFAQGTYTAGAKTAETKALADHWRTWNQTWLAGKTQDEVAKIEEQSRQFQFRRELQGYSIDARKAIAIQAEHLREQGMGVEAAFRTALAKGNNEQAMLRAQYEQGQMNYRAGDTGDDGSTDDGTGTGGNTTNVYVGGQPGGNGNTQATRTGKTAVAPGKPTLYEYTDGSWRAQ